MAGYDTAVPAGGISAGCGCTAALAAQLTLAFGTAGHRNVYDVVDLFDGVTDAARFRDAQGRLETGSPSQFRCRRRSRGGLAVRAAAGSRRRCGSGSRRSCATRWSGPRRDVRPRLGR